MNEKDENNYKGKYNFRFSFGAARASFKEALLP